MAVREALLALLLGGPAYGFQLHGALATRTGGRRRINVGQSYATLERATKSGLIESAGTTDDGLPLHRLTEAGTALALGWLGGADAAGAEPWDETIDRVLIAASLPEIDERPILDAELGRWGTRLTDAEARAGSEVDSDARPDLAPEAGAVSALTRLAASADAARARAALDWLAVAALAAASGTPLTFAPTTERPRRGRRPRPSAAAAESVQPSAMP
ncbi:PadR family transcriptional regulator [Agromyces endophyticus]|uniref:PadR family transcriptional regulator n=1 Tax=Agromyces sp. H17E-10 TaxID=2932244 RepID=UPI001FD19C8E|nr:helix-turn-helix transcriptional regulator [Agromyces sp. H17E-10]UOQ89328.1 PadR family transcriptional regulator [Agromyces sp. H17E-10]